MTRLLLKFLADSRGATSIEYGVIAVTISIVIVGGATAIGTKLQNQWYGQIASGLN